MDILQNTVLIIRRDDTEIGFKPFTPCLWQISNLQIAFQECQLEIETQHDMEVIGNFVCIRANEGAFHFVNRTVKRI